ncbi:proton/glutamate symporter [Legionella antarctica]|uniref:Proton/glutamate symporter n=1 Tax=Legionella antarctica TaxID=2708020 RepID=A0A6F8T806_9GAMM|nr:dicarboxylate/amino acid:cation symporter [Legionella antarctica]BCA96287.1 proton/glutamate symporter [Legionella antarctica]
MDKSSANRLNLQIIIAIVSGIIVGALLKLIPEDSWVFQYLVEGCLDWGGKVFITILKMLVIPVVFVSLVCGTFNISSSSQFGRTALKTIVLYLFTTSIAISLALFVSIVLGTNGSSITPVEQQSQTLSTPTIKETLLNLVPSNPVKAMAEGNMLQVIIFALLLGISITGAGRSAQKIKDLFKAADAVVMRLVHIVFLAAPYGIFCLISVMFARIGINLIMQLSGYFFTVLLALALHLFIVYPILLKSFTGLSPLIFFRQMWPAMMFAFSTSSSNASIPVVLKTVEEKLGVNESIASFIIPLGATINMDGTAIMQGVATVFISHVYGIDLGLSGYLTVILLATLASIGTAGVPGVGLVTLTMVLIQVGLPVEGISLIIGIDRLLDMSRTIVNICGDATVACIVGYSEQALNEKKYYELNSIEI